MHQVQCLLPSTLQPNNTTFSGWTRDWPCLKEYPPHLALAFKLPPFSVMSFRIGIRPLCVASLSTPFWALALRYSFRQVQPHKALHERKRKTKFTCIFTGDNTKIKMKAYESTFGLETLKDLSWRLFQLAVKMICTSQSRIHSWCGRRKEQATSICPARVPWSLEVKLQGQTKSRSQYGNRHFPFCPPDLLQ